MALIEPTPVALRIKPFKWITVDRRLPPLRLFVLVAIQNTTGYSRVSYQNQKRAAVAWRRSLAQTDHWEWVSHSGPILGEVYAWCALPVLPHNWRADIPF